ncbi:MAG: restriction endonuclease [Lachnospiraceae bacterium]|nr:restriction endonuclease [Lachnospiraceae bacterium]
MSIPKYNELYGAVLRELSDGQIHTYKEMKKDLINMLGISDEERSLMLPSGKLSVFYSRVGWARTYLKKAGLIDSPARAKYVLSDAGKAALADADIIDNNYLSRFDSFRDFINKSSNNNTSSQPSSSDKSPDEILKDAFNTINNALADDLMTEVMKLTPTGFEQLVVNLLTKMGYGGGLEGSATVTPPSNDGGIDGIIREDPLGFDMIYIQAN